MSAAFFLRELKRLGSLALAAWILPALVYGVILVLRQTDLRGDVPELDDARGVALALAVIVAPWILGAASFAPERESGAASFLARLPLPVWKLLLIRFGAILVCLACVHAPVWALASWWEMPFRSLELLAGASVASLALLGGAIYASLSLKRSLSAFAAGPVLVWAGSYLVVLPWIGFGLRLREHEIFAGLGLLALGVLACIAWAAKAQRPLSGLHPLRFAWRPAAVLCLVNVGSAAALTGYDLSHYEVSAHGLIRTSSGAAGVNLAESRGVRRDAGHANRVLLGREGQVAILPPGYALVGLSETHAFTHHWGRPQAFRLHLGSLWRLDDLSWSDPDQLCVTPEEVGRHDLVRLDRGHLGEGALGHFPTLVLWAGEVPCEAGMSWILTASERTVDLPEGWFVRAAAGKSVIAYTPAGELRLFRLSERGLDQISRPESWEDLQALFPELRPLVDVVPSPSGECLLGYAESAQGAVAAGLDLRLSEPRAEELLRSPVSLNAEWPLMNSPTALELVPALGHPTQRIPWDPSPPAPLDAATILPLSGEAGLLLVKGELRVGSAKRSRAVSLPD